jgi:hypothetical protein
LVRAESIEVSLEKDVMSWPSCLLTRNVSSVLTRLSVALGSRCDLDLPELLLDIEE